MVIHKHGKYYNRVFKMDLTCYRCDCEFTIFGTWSTDNGGDYNFPDVIETDRLSYDKIVPCPDCGENIPVDDEEPEIVDDGSESIDMLPKKDINSDKNLSSSSDIIW